MHGYLSSGNSFIHQTNYFRRDYEVYAPDLKGFGSNEGMEYPYSLDDYIESVKEYMYKNSIITPNVIAHSFGGRIALKMAYQDKTAFNKIVLTGSAGLKPRASFFKKIKKAEFKVLKKFIDKSKLTRFYSKDYNALSPVMKQSFIKIVNEHLDYTLPYIDNETLIINGSLDKETPLYTAHTLAKNIKNSELYIISGGGHFSFIDYPLTFNFKVKEFLSK